jgi:hypothetical protein
VPISDEEGFTNTTYCLPPEPINSIANAPSHPATETANILSIPQPDGTGDTVKKVTNDVRNLKEEYEEHVGLRQRRVDKNFWVKPTENTLSATQPSSADDPTTPYKERVSLRQRHIGNDRGAKPTENILSATQPSSADDPTTPYKEHVNLRQQRVGQNLCVTSTENRRSTAKIDDPIKEAIRGRSKGLSFFETTNNDGTNLKEEPKESFGMRKRHGYKISE